MDGCLENRSVLVFAGILNRSGKLLKGDAKRTGSHLHIQVLLQEVAVFHFHGPLAVLDQRYFEGVSNRQSLEILVGVLFGKHGSSLFGFFCTQADGREGQGGE